MTNPVFPTLTEGQDSKYFTITPDDPAMRAPLEGGYEFTRPRTTRAPRKTYSSGFSFIGDADKALLEAFWDTVKGGSVIFDWVRPNDEVTLAVRFAEPLAWKYVGHGPYRRWDVTFKVKEA